MPDSPAPRLPARPISPVKTAPRPDEKVLCDRCGEPMFRLQAVWRCPRCGFKTDCCGW